MAKEIATLGGGCFWCLDAIFEQISGVESVVSGYSGGQVPNPTYRAVCEGNTGHAEVVRVTFDPDEISYEKLLEIFFTIHDPTSLNRKGNDSGTQYCSVIFHHSDAQNETAMSVMRRLEEANLWDAPVVTEIRSEVPFFPAEDYHQHYFSRNLVQRYCQIVISPKVTKFRKSFRSLIGMNTGSEKA